ncbi:MAG: deoxyguanosinetriphosphate triphosphohydrolase [Rhodospirillaceae bacterium]
MITNLSTYRDCMGPVAADPAHSRGRLHPEPEAATRTAFQRDRDRIIHSSAFRRLKYKTQVFVYHEGDNYRTRLSHSLEVAQIARSISRFTGLNEDLAETLALAHDLGHTCFGHAGEGALQECMAPFNGFDHNAQGLRILTKLEQRYPGFDGLNLTWETLEGLVKHNGPLSGGGVTEAVPLAILEYVAGHDLELDRFASAEAQVAAVADDIAYNAHDIDDGLQAGLFSLSDLTSVPLIGPIVEDVAHEYPDLDDARRVHEIVRRLIGAMVNDVIFESQRRMADLKPERPEDVHSLKAALVGFSVDMTHNDKALKGFLFPNMYRHHRVTRMADQAVRVVHDLFELLHQEPDKLPLDWQGQMDGPRGVKTARRVADYIAGMTDRFALAEHTRLFGPGLLI